jgi:hypothetical protein
MTKQSIFTLIVGIVIIGVFFYISKTTPPTQVSPENTVATSTIFTNENAINIEGIEENEEVMAEPVFDFEIPQGLFYSEPIEPEETGENIDMSIVNDKTKWKIFTDVEIGITFSYPDIFNKVSHHVSNGYDVMDGDAGKSFFISLGWIDVSGLTPDYQYPRGGSVHDFRGFRDEYGNYEEPTYDEVWYLKDGKTKAFVKYNILEPKPGVTIDGSIGVYINTPDLVFGGIAFIVLPHEFGKQLSNDQISVLKEIIATVDFN